MKLLGKDRFKLIVILGALTAIGPLSIDMYLPGFKAIASDLQTSMSSVGLSLTSYFFGYAFGQLIYGPLLDRFGRRKPLVFGLVLYGISTLMCAISPHISWLIASRFFLSIGGCAGVVASRAIVRDYFDITESAKFFSALMLVMGLAPIIAPVLGSLITVYLGWRFIFYILTIFTLLLLAATMFYLPPVKGGDKTVSLKFGVIFRNYKSILANPVFLAYGLAGSVTYASLFAYISGSPFVYMKVFGLSELHYSWAFGINAMGLIIGSQTNRYWLKKTNNSKITVYSFIALTTISVVLLLGTGFDYFSPFASMFWIFCFVFFLGILNPNTVALAMSPFSKNAGSASALMGSIQMAISALVSALVSSTSNGSVLPMVIGMSVCACIGLVVVVLYSLKKSSNHLPTAPEAS